MTSSIFWHIIRFITVVFLQVIVLNHVALGGYINPYFYIFFILLLPFNTPKWLLLSSAFLLGLSVDLFSGVLGIHTAATVFIAFIRPSILKIISYKQEYESSTDPTIGFMGFNWVASYSFILIFLHHTVLFFVDIFTFREFFSTIGRSILSSVLTLIMVIITHYLFYKEKK